MISNGCLYLLGMYDSASVGNLATKSLEENLKEEEDRVKKNQPTIGISTDETMDEEGSAGRMIMNNDDYAAASTDYDESMYNEPATIQEGSIQEGFQPEGEPEQVVEKHATSKLLLGGGLKLSGNSVSDFGDNAIKKGSTRRNEGVHNVITGSKKIVTAPFKMLRSVVYDDADSSTSDPTAATTTANTAAHRDKPDNSHSTTQVDGFDMDIDTSKGFAVPGYGVVHHNETDDTSTYDNKHK